MPHPDAICTTTIQSWTNLCTLGTAREPPGHQRTIQHPPDTDSSHSTTALQRHRVLTECLLQLHAFSQAPDGASMECSLAHIRSAMPPAIEVNGYGEFFGLLHYSLHSVLYEGKLYPIALHLFEVRKFLTGPTSRNVSDSASA